MHDSKTLPVKMVINRSFRKPIMNSGFQQVNTNSFQRLNPSVKRRAIEVFTENHSGLKPIRVWYQISHEKI